MSDAAASGSMSPKLLKVAERARRDPKSKFYSLGCLVDEAALERAYRRQRKNAAVGVDGVTKERYGKNLKAKLQDLSERIRTMQYRHQPILRVYIPKEQGKGKRPIGISAFEDKLVQDALREVLEAVYEQDFLDCSYGCRRGRSTHDAIRALDRAAYKGKANWVLEIDVKSFFDSVNHRMLLEMLQERVPDGSIRRLVGKCLHVGVLESGVIIMPEKGTAQGSCLSPLLANIYLHYALDKWFEDDAKPLMRGEAQLLRYVDDAVIIFERRDDAQRVMNVLGKRVEKFELTLHPEKTRMIPFGRPSKSQKKGKGPGTFDFLGFTLYWRKTLKGRWAMACKTRRARLKRAIDAVYVWCRKNRHLTVPQQHAALGRRIRGHINYFGVNGNSRSVAHLVYHAKRAWYKWLCRRSQRKRLNWKRFQDLLRDYPLPEPRVMVQIWGT